ncbi:MAG: TatD family hydrolase [Clostridia bacterium]
MIDTHCHIDDPIYDPERKALINSLSLRGVKAIINNSSDYPSMIGGYNLANTYPNVFCAVGMHPHECMDYNQDFETRLISLASSPKVVAVGEIGLDYFYDKDFADKQKEVFARQIEVADNLELPIILHIREAYSDCLDVLNMQKRFLNNKIVFHCYSGSAEFAEILLKNYDAYFGLGGTITYKNNKKIDEICRVVPYSRVLTETDCPYLSPNPKRGQTNYPYYISYVLEKLASLYNTSIEEMERITEENALRVYPKLIIK